MCISAEDLDIADLRAIQQAGLRLGISTHDDTGFAACQSAASILYRAGAYFPDTNQNHALFPQGIRKLSPPGFAATPDFRWSPSAVFPNVPRCFATGVGSIAVVSAIIKAADWQGCHPATDDTDRGIAEYQEVNHAE